jgi:hypothetical protein
MVENEEPTLDEAQPLTALTTLTAPLEGEGESPSDDFTDAERFEEEFEDGRPALEERILHLSEPVTEMLDDETELAEDALDEEQRADIEWRIGEAGADDGTT